MKALDRHKPRSPRAGVLNHGLMSRRTGPPPTSLTAVAQRLARPLVAARPPVRVLARGAAVAHRQAARALGQLDRRALGRAAVRAELGSGRGRGRGEGEGAQGGSRCVVGGGGSSGGRCSAGGGAKGRRTGGAGAGGGGHHGAVVSGTSRPLGSRNGRLGRGGARCGSGKGDRRLSGPRLQAGRRAGCKAGCSVGCGAGC